MTNTPDEATKTQHATTDPPDQTAVRPGSTVDTPDDRAAGTAAASPAPPGPPRRDNDRWPRWTWAAYALLVAVGVPWYWPNDFDVAVLGWPVWALVSLAASVGISALTAFLAVAYWHVAERGDDGD
ncbi:MAG: hypothetical protein ACE5E6_01630 [Phycisphaerae bacterium]